MNIFYYHNLSGEQIQYPDNNTGEEIMWNNCISSQNLLLRYTCGTEEKMWVAIAQINSIKSYGQYKDLSKILQRITRSLWKSVS